MKSNNKLQYLQKLATKNQLQQSGASKKLSQTNNLVGIGQSMGQPYVVGPRFDQKQVKHQPKKKSVIVEQSPMNKVPSNKKFTHKNNPSKSSVVVSKDYFNVNMDIKDPRFDKFESIPMALGIFEDDDKIEQLRKSNRKKQMDRRHQKLLKKAEKNLFKNKTKDPTIKFEQLDEDIQIRQQASTDNEPRVEQSLGVAKDTKLKLGKKLKRINSDVKSNASLQIGQNPKSEFTVSSAGRNPEMEDFDEDGNSIISEVDTVFEDQTPAVNNGLKEAPQASFSLPYGAKKSRENSPKSKISITQLQNEKDIVGDKKPYIKQKTHGWKEQTNHDISRWPFKRSPTNKSKNGDHESQGSKIKFGMKVVPPGFQKPTGFTQQSRYSSLNYTVDNQMDQLSVNVTKNLMFTKGDKGGQGGLVKDHSFGKMDSQSVVSVITKGGTVINPFSQKKNSKAYLAKSISKSSSIKIGVSARGHKNKTHLLAGEQEIGGLASKTHVRFGEELDDDLDVRRSYYKNNQKMINIYLKTPYKVLTIDQIKNKEKFDRERDLFENVNGSPNKLFIAENNLKIHTLIGERNNFSTVKGKGFKKNLINVSAGDEENLSNYKSKVRQTGFSTTKIKSLFKDASISQISDEKNKDLIELESGPNLNSSQDLQSEQNNLTQLTYDQLKQLKTQKNQLEIEFKKKFLSQLQTQLVKRIEQVKFQTNVLAKQKNLFAIYGNTTNNNLSPDNHIRSFNNVSIETIQAGIDLDEIGSNNKKRYVLQGKYKTAVKAGESKHSSSESPSKPEGYQAQSVLKGSIQRIQEPPMVKQNTNVSKYSRLSDNEFTKDDIKEQDEDEKEHHMSGYSYDFEQEASLKKLLSMSNNLGYSQFQIRELRQKQKELEQAEKKLQKQQLLKGNETFLNSRNIGQNNSGSFVVLNDAKSKKQPPKFANTRSKTDKKPPMGSNLTSIKEKESKFDLDRSIDNEDNVKDYFDNKMSMRRSIEKKLHHENKINNNKAAGHNYQTSAQKHQQLLTDLKNVKKERARAYNLNAYNQNTEGSSYEQQVPAKQLRFKTYDSLKNGPRVSQYDEKDSTLPDINAQSLRKQKSSDKQNENQDPLDDNFYPYKKSGTQNERQNDIGFSPIRVKRNNVVKAYEVNQIKTTNAQYLTAQGQYNAESLMTKHNNTSKKQLGFQFMNKSPRPSVLSNGLHKESGFMFEKDSPSQPQKFNSNTTSSKFIHNKQIQLMKGVLSNPRQGNPRQNRTNLKNKDLMNIHINEASSGTLPKIHQTSSYAPGQ